MVKHASGTRGRAELMAHVQTELRSASQLAARVAETLAEPISELALRVLDTLHAGRKVLFCGNGGSAADAQHLAAEYVVRYQRKRGSLPAVALTTDTSVLTAAGNDLGFEHVFARQLEALGEAGDLLVLHSTTGNSPNLLETARVARATGVHTAALLAKGGGALREYVDLAIIIPTDEAARAQEIQLAIGHTVADWVDRHWAGSSENRTSD